MYLCTYVCIMYVYMYVRMYVCTYVCLYVCMYVRMYVCMYSTDILCIQEPHTIQNKAAGLSDKYNMVTSGEGRSRAAIVITNNRLDSLLIKQLSDEDTVVIEVTNDNKKIILASMYFDISQRITIDLQKIEAMTQHAKGAEVLTAMDSNCRSALWRNTLTDTRGRIFEEFLTSKQLYIMNEESDYTTFRSRHVPAVPI